MSGAPRSAAPAGGSARPSPPEPPPEPSPARGWLPWLLAGLPVVAPVVFGALVAVPATHALAVRLLSENQLVESATFAAFAIGALVMAGRAVEAYRTRAPALLIWGSLAAALVLFVMAMEEVSWTQWFFGFATPEGMREVNLQHEFNLHNLPIVQDLNEWFLCVAGFAGFLWSRRRPRGPLVVRRALAPGFLMVGILAALELITLQAPLGHLPDEVITRLVEVAEFDLAWCALGWAVTTGLRAPQREG